MNKKNSSTAEPNTAQNADPEIAYQANLAGTLCLISCFKSFGIYFLSYILIFKNI